MNKLTKQTQGFTIIEVVLVLAIAALILLMVFIAWPALQRNQRDTARKQDAQVVASAIGSYKGNNNGKLPTSGAGGTWGTFVTQYVSGTNATSQIDSANISTGASATTKAPDSDHMVVDLGAKCDGTASTRSAAVWVKLESGGGVDFCVDA